MAESSESGVHSAPASGQQIEPQPLAGGGGGPRGGGPDGPRGGGSGGRGGGGATPEAASQTEIFFDWFFGLWFFRVLLKKVGLERYLARPGVRENIVSGLIVSALAGAAIVATIKIPNWWEEQKLDREIRAGFRLEAMKHRQQLAGDFAYSIPQSLLLVEKIKALDSQAYGIRKGIGESPSNSQGRLGEIESEIAALNAEWRDGKNYLSLCELVGMRFEAVRPYSSALNSCIDMLTEQDIRRPDQDGEGSPSRFLQMAERYCRVRQGLPPDSMLYCDHPPRWVGAGLAGATAEPAGCLCQEDSSFHLASKPGADDPRIGWMRDSNREMHLAYRWMRVGVIADDPGHPQYDEYVKEKGYTAELAHRNAFDATRRALKRAADVLYVETVRAIGRELENQVEQTEPDKAEQAASGSGSG